MFERPHKVSCKYDPTLNFSSAIINYILQNNFNNSFQQASIPLEHNDIEIIHCTYQRKINKYRDTIAIFIDLIRVVNKSLGCAYPNIVSVKNFRCVYNFHKPKMIIHFKDFMIIPYYIRNSCNKLSTLYSDVLSEKRAKRMFDCDNLFFCKRFDFLELTNEEKFILEAELMRIKNGNK